MIVGICGYSLFWYWGWLVVWVGNWIFVDSLILVYIVVLYCCWFVLWCCRSYSYMGWECWFVWFFGLGNCWIFCWMLWLIVCWIGWNIILVMCWDCLIDRVLDWDCCCDWCCLLGWWWGLVLVIWVVVGLFVGYSLIVGIVCWWSLFLCLVLVVFWYNGVWCWLGLLLCCCWDWYNFEYVDWCIWCGCLYCCWVLSCLVVCWILLLYIWLWFVCVGWSWLLDWLGFVVCWVCLCWNIWWIVYLDLVVISCVGNCCLYCERYYLCLVVKGCWYLLLWVLFWWSWLRCD